MKNLRMRSGFLVVFLVGLSWSFWSQDLSVLVKEKEPAFGIYESDLRRLREISLTLGRIFKSFGVGLNDLEPFLKDLSESNKELELQRRALQESVRRLEQRLTSAMMHSQSLEQSLIELKADTMRQLKAEYHRGLRDGMLIGGGIGLGLGGLAGFGLGTLR